MLSSNFTVCHRPVVSLRSTRRGSFCEDCGEVRNVQRSVRPLSQVRQQSQSGPEVRAGATQEAVFIPYLPPSVEAVLAGEVQPVFQQPVLENTDEKPAPALPEEPPTPLVQKPMRSTSQTLREIAALSIPALGSTLADPVCSLVDTAAVGQVSSVQLAALSPCTAIFNLVFLVFQFVGVTITNKLAANSPFAAGLSATQAAERQHDNKRLISYSLTFAIIAGVMTTAGLLGFSQQILGVMGTSAEMMAPAISYLQWRAIAAPAVMIMNVCQGICLGQQNSVLPLAVFSGVGLLNVVLDVWLILGGPAMGCTGAAIATAAAQWIGAAYFLQHLMRKGQEGKSVEIQWMGLPTAKDLQPFIGMASVLLSRTIFSMTAFTLITGVATAQGTIAAASHQVCLQLFWFLSYFPEPLSVAAQSLIARDRSSKASTLLLTRCILGLAAGLGVTIATACAVAFVFCAGVFTPNPVIASTMQSVAKPAFVALIMCCFAMAMDGISIGSDDYQHLPAVNFAGLAATAAWLQWCMMQNLGLPGIWMGMVVVFAVRLSVHLLHHLGTHAETSMVAAALGLQRFFAVGLRRLPVRAVALPNSA